MYSYSAYSPSRSQNRGHKRGRSTKFLLLLVAVLFFFGYRFITRPTIEEKVEHNLQFDASVTTSEQELLNKILVEQKIDINSPVTAKVKISEKPTNNSFVLKTYTPVTSFNAIRQKITKAELVKSSILVKSGTDSTEKAALVSALGLNASSVKEFSSLDSIKEDEIALVPVEELTGNAKLLELDGSYYLDSFTSGGIFREVEFVGEGASAMATLKLPTLYDSSSVFKVNMTGVTALTRVMMNKLNSVKDPLYFSQKIGDFLKNADLTHVSNEVSFKQGCTYHAALFCSPPQFIETLKASGVDLVELTGNHNNDVGSQYNTESINLYHSLGWGTYGGGLNKDEAAKPYVADQKGSKVTFLAYNYPDSPNGGAISGANKAGANSFDSNKVKSDIQAAKTNSQFVVVNVQYWECYSYPNGYVEFPECDKPIGEQESIFKQIIDYGADMVVGSSAHQPQTYELYKGKPVYYGLGNLYFEQTSWPGTERGIILTHYFKGGKLLQTKLTPTVYDEALQTHIMTDTQAKYFFTRLHDAR